jgi:hypothetical protein
VLPPLGCQAHQRATSATCSQHPAARWKKAVKNMLSPSADDQKLKVYGGASICASNPNCSNFAAEHRKTMIGEWNNGTGRRKSSVARVFLEKGTGKITVNDRTFKVLQRQTSISRQATLF